MERVANATIDLEHQQVTVMTEVGTQADMCMGYSRADFEILGTISSLGEL